VSATSDFTALTLTTATAGASGADATITFKAGAVGTATISIGTSSAVAATDILTVTVVASCDAGTSPSATYSFAQAQDAAKAVAAGETDTGFGALGARLTSNTDGTGSTVVTVTEGSGYMLVSLQGAYNQVLASKAVIATVTSGDAYVNVATAGASVPAAGTAKTAVTASTGEQLVVRVSPITAGAPTKATVAVSYNGETVATKSYTFQGVASKIVISDVTVGSVVDGFGYFRYLIQDAAGNNLYSRAILDDTTANAPAAVAAISTGVVPGSSTTAADGAKSDAATGSNPAKFDCEDAGTTTLGARYVDPATPAVSIKASFAIICGGALDTWSISLDKASYQPGEIATLTVTGKDEDGVAVASTQSLGTPVYSFGGLTAVTAPTTGDVFSSGIGTKTYQFSVGTTEGAFVGTFKIAGDTDTAAKTLQYKVAATSGAVSNADVLKAIVSLIASINKQIAALQKALLKR
jgi:hypothetical protein